MSDSDSQSSKSKTNKKKPKSSAARTRQRPALDFSDLSGAPQGPADSGTPTEPSPCSFCGKTVINRPALSGIDTAIICLDCVNNGKELLDKEVKEILEQEYIEQIEKHLITPRLIHRILDDHVIGQSAAKRTLAVAIYLHYKRIIDKFKNGGKSSPSVSVPSLSPQNLQATELEKANVLLVGPTGVGKTLLASTLARILGVPFAIADATTLTESGYVGDDVENILLRLLQNADFQVAWAEKGIIFIDEIDKIGRKSESASITRDVSGEGVQQALLKIIEGTTARVPLQGGRKHPQGQTVSMKTQDILFITGGAFVGLEDIVRRRTEEGFMGFGKIRENIAAKNTTKSPESTPSKNPKQKEAALSPAKELSLRQQEVIPDDLIKFGIIPELIGRLPIVATLKELTDSELRRILTEPQNALMKQYRKRLAIEGLELVVEDDFYDEVLQHAKLLKTGARSLKNVLETIMESIFYEAPEKKGKTVILSKAVLSTGEFFSENS